MLCETCMYDSDEGWCGLGSKLLGGTCSGYVEGKEAVPMVVLPPHISYLVGVGTTYLKGIPFPVRGGTHYGDTSWPHSQHYMPNEDTLLSTYDHDGMFTVTHTIAILPGDMGYQVLRTSLGEHAMHLIEGGTPPDYRHGELTIAISGRYSRGGGPILVEVSLRTREEYPDLTTIDLRPYIWWLNTAAPDYAVEYYLQGLMALEHADLVDVWQVERSSTASSMQVMEVEPVPLRAPSPWVHPIVSNYSVITYKGEGVREHLLAKYVQHTQDYRHLTVGEVEQWASRWEGILNGCRQRYVRYR